MNSDRLVLLGILLIGALTNVGLIIAYTSRLNLRGRVTRQLIFVASTGAAEYLTLSALVLGVHVPAWWFITGYGIADLAAIRWLILFYWAQRGAPRNRRLGKVDKVAKAIAAAVLAGYSLFDLAQADDVITGTEWARIAVAVVVSGLVTWAVPNAKPGVQTERTTPTE
jgi:hypothetical protein